MDVKIIKRERQKALIEWKDNGLPKRGTVPEELLNGDTIDDTLVSLAVPYGIDWAFVLEGAIRIINFEDIAASLYKHGIWTLEDIRRNPQAVMGAIQSAYGLDYSSIIRLAEDFQKTIGGK